MSTSSIKLKSNNRPNLKVVENPIADVLAAEASDRFCREQTYFDAIQLIGNNFQSTPLLTTSKVFINLSRKYGDEARADKALEILDGLAFALRQLEPHPHDFSETDTELVHYECLLDLEYARLGEIRFARERVVNRIKELNNRRIEGYVGVANEKCFDTLDEIDAMQPEFGSAFQRIKPMLKRLEQTKRTLKSMHPRSLPARNRKMTNYLTGWQPIVLVFIMMLCSIARGHLIESIIHDVTHGQPHYRLLDFSSANR